MRQQIDVVMDGASTELVIGGGDFVMGETTAQCQKNLILCNKGEFKESPTACVGAFMYLDSEDFNDLLREISKQFSADGMDVAGVQLLPDGTVRSDAVYV